MRVKEYLFWSICQKSYCNAKVNSENQVQNIAYYIAFTSAKMNLGKGMKHLSLSLHFYGLNKLCSLANIWKGNKKKILRDNKKVKIQMSCKESKKIAWCSKNH